MGRPHLRQPYAPPVDIPKNPVRYAYRPISQVLAEREAAMTTEEREARAASLAARVAREEAARVAELERVAKLKSKVAANVQKKPKAAPPKPPAPPPTGAVSPPKPPPPPTRKDDTMMQIVDGRYVSTATLTKRADAEANRKAERERLYQEQQRKAAELADAEAERDAVMAERASKYSDEQLRAMAATPSLAQDKELARWLHAKAADAALQQSKEREERALQAMRRDMQFGRA